jgi:hypothetical protein
MDPLAGATMALPKNPDRPNKNSGVDPLEGKLHHDLVRPVNPAAARDLINGDSAPVPSLGRPILPGPKKKG